MKIFDYEFNSPTGRRVSYEIILIILSAISQSLGSWEPALYYDF